MDKIQKDVSSESSTENEASEVVEETTETPQQEEGQEQQEQVEDGASQPQEVKNEGIVKDDRPIQNVAWEAKRKADEVYNLMSELKPVLENLGKQQSQPQTPQSQYSKAQLRAYLATPDLPVEHRIWAENEVEKLDKSDREKEMRGLFESYTKTTQDGIRRQQANQYVAQSFPQCFVKDNQGNILGWDNSNPLTQKIGEYMQRHKQLNDDPEGIVAATKMAAFDLGISQSKEINKKLNQTTAQLRREQKKTLAAGGGSTMPKESGNISKYNKLLENYRKTGDKTSFKEAMKLRGIIQTKEE